MIEKDGCGVGFLVSLKKERSHETLQKALKALHCVEHRGGVGSDGIMGDGSGVMTGIPYELFGRKPETFAVANLFTPRDDAERELSLRVFEDCFDKFGLKVAEYREVRVDESVLSPKASGNRPYFIQAIIERPRHCRTLFSFERLLYSAKQLTRTKEKENGISKKFFFSSLSPRTINYKALCRGEDLVRFYKDLQNPEFKTSFAVFHRRFSTNTLSTWDKTQPFRLIAHNGEINTIEGNRAWAITREKALGLRKDELITHEGISDSGNLNGIAEALRYNSSIPRTSEIMAILMPPAGKDRTWYQFWSRGMEPWDGPALVSFCDGKNIGARLDRNGFRPCRWKQTEDFFYLSSETGVFDVEEKSVLAKGALSAGGSVAINVYTGDVSFLDPEDFPEHKDAFFESHLIPIDYRSPEKLCTSIEEKQKYFGYSKEDLDNFILPMTLEGKEPVGSMGDTARLAVLSDEDRPLYDYFYQDFAQVTNPPLDYIREKTVTDVRCYLGRKPNIFEPKEFIPPKASFLLKGPILSLGQMEYLVGLEKEPLRPELRSRVIPILFPAGSREEGFLERIDEICAESINAIREGITLLILSDRDADDENLPLPSLLVLRAVNMALNDTGRRLRASVIVDTGDARNSHHIACLLGFGASAVCPWLALTTACKLDHPGLKHQFVEERERRMIRSLSSGVLRIMAKMGISVLRSYQGSKLLTSVGLSQELLDRFFPKKTTILGGLGLGKLISRIEKRVKDKGPLAKSFVLKEQASEKSGELHSLTSKRSRLVHGFIQEVDPEKQFALYRQYSDMIWSRPTLIRHLFTLKNDGEAGQIESLESILERFGSGGMSFGALSAESQRDLFVAFKNIGGRSNSGEGGENPYFYSEGIRASVKQIASGRFGVTADYLYHADEVQIKIAQGAKPGEGGQLPGNKVSGDIARARFSSPGVDLISPPPQHDIYSIEDLKELIDEIRQLRPQLKVSVKLVSGRNIGAIALGVVKAGADIIQISGGDGGTGAASLISMRHAGLPLEVGLWEVHQALVENEVRHLVKLRADGSMLTGRDLVHAAVLGADQFDFGKLVLVGQGCIMARVCHKNTCPAGIATQDPKFKSKYKGDAHKVEVLLKLLARDVREILKDCGVSSLDEIRGRGDLIIPRQEFSGLLREQQIDLKHFQHRIKIGKVDSRPVSHSASKLNGQILAGGDQFEIKNTDRAVPATLAGEYVAKGGPSRTINFKGSAGQGFGVFNVEPMNLILEGEANDSVAKAMSGGQIVIRPPADAPYDPSMNTIIGNCTLYGATGGRLLVRGRAGDRFAVRNSGAIAVVEGVGLHACEYMTGGLVWILGEANINIGAGMTGGELIVHKSNAARINEEYLKRVPWDQESTKTILSLGGDYERETGAQLNFDDLEQTYFRYLPRNLLGY